MRIRFASAPSALLALGFLASCAPTSTGGEDGPEDKGGSSGKGGSGVGPSPGGDKVDTDTFIPPGQRVVRRLTSIQYRNAVAQALGIDISDDVALPIDRQVGRFASGSNQPSPSVAVSKIYADAAASLAEAAVAESHREKLFDKSGCGDDDACLAEFTNRIGLKLFRRPVENGETEILVQDAKTAGGGFWERAAYVLEVMMQSPSFLYVTDTGEESQEHPGFIERDAYSLATRLSLLAWNSGPDDELLNAAAEGKLKDVDGLREQLHRLMADRKAMDAQRSFLREWLGYDLAPTKTKADEHVHYTTDLAKALVEELDQTVTKHLESQKPTSELFSLERSYGPDSAKAFYGIEGGRDDDGAFPLPEERRSVFGLGAFIAANSGSAKPSPTLRGKLILNRFLCQDVGSPPADAPAELPEAEDAGPLTIRERTERFMLAEGTACKGCHQMMDPVGFLFENFDVTGKHRSEETIDGERKPVSSEGAVLALEDRTLSGLAELGEMLSTSREAQACVVRQFLEWGLGRADEQGDADLAEAILSLEEKSAPPLSTMTEGLAMSRSFRFTRAE